MHPKVKNFGELANSKENSTFVRKLWNFKLKTSRNGTIIHIQHIIKDKAAVQADNRR